MAEAKHRQVALMSIHAEYAASILSGEKKVEFRKRTLSPFITHVLLYATLPEGRVVGVFEVARQEVMDPARLWDELGELGCISHHKFGEYYSGSQSGVGIHIGSVIPAAVSVSLQALGISRPPQSVQYLDMSVHEALALLCPGRVSAD